MNLALVVPAYLSWHYSAALFHLFNIWRNFVWFTYHFFSIGILLRTLFSPWRRLGEEYRKDGLDLWGWFETFLVNTLMRLVGAIVRLCFIVVGIIALAAVVASLAVALLVWLLLPLGILSCFISGIILLL